MSVVFKQQNKNYPGVFLEFLNGLNGLSIYQESKPIYVENCCMVIGQLDACQPKSLNKKMPFRIVRRLGFHCISFVEF